MEGESVGKTLIEYSNLEKTLLSVNKVVRYSLKSMDVSNRVKTIMLSLAVIRLTLKTKLNYVHPKDFRLLHMAYSFNILHIYENLRKLSCHLAVLTGKVGFSKGYDFRFPFKLFHKYPFIAYFTYRLPFPNRSQRFLLSMLLFFNVKHQNVDNE